VENGLLLFYPHYKQYDDVCLDVDVAMFTAIGCNWYIYNRHLTIYKVIVEFLSKYFRYVEKISIYIIGVI